MVIVTKHSHSDRTEFAFLRCDKEVQMFELHCRELEAFKSEFGHCNVPCVYSKSDRILSQIRIERLEGIGLSGIIVILKHSRASLGTVMLPRDTPRVFHRGRGAVR